MSKPRQADGFEGYIFGQIDMIADGSFEYIDLPSQENALRIFLADEGDAACSYIFTETNWRPYDLPDAPPGQCFAAKHVPLGSARYGISSASHFFRKKWLYHTLGARETTIYDRENEEIIGLYRELMDHRPSFFIRPFLGDEGIYVCGEDFVRYGGIVRTLAPHSGKGGAV